MVFYSRRGLYGAFVLTDIFEASEQTYFTGEAGANGLLGSALRPPQTSTLFSINPLDPNWAEHARLCQQSPSTPRFSLNVTKFRNFIFESDILSPDEQLIEWLKLAELIPIKHLTFSGGKSYHAIISCLDELPFEPHTIAGVQAYKQTWKGLKSFLEFNSKLSLDASTKDPSRLTRIPGAFRGTMLQSAIEFQARFITSMELLRITASHMPLQTAAIKATWDAVGVSNLTLLLEKPAHRYLNNKLKNPAKWIGPTNMYPALLRLTLWAIDELNPTYDAWLEALSTDVLPAIRATGYPRDLTIAIKAAYIYKGLL